jgi:hypothetical protein
MKLNQGEIVVALDGKELVLKPTLNAIRAISRTYKGTGGALEALRTMDFDAVVNMIRIGANLSELDARRLDERVFAEMGRDDAAFGELLVKLMRFVGMLQNGGKPPEDQPKDENDRGGQDAGSSLGN